MDNSQSFVEVVPKLQFMYIQVRAENFFYPSISALCLFFICFYVYFHNTYHYLHIVTIMLSITIVTWVGDVFLSYLTLIL